MKNNIFKLFATILLCFFVQNISFADQFNFDVSEVQILENGNKFIGTKKGKITTKEGIEIIANQFEYYKDKNILKANGDVKIFDNLNNYEIYTDQIIYKKNEEIILTYNNSRAISLNDSITITANDFRYEILNNTIEANQNVLVNDVNKDYKIFTENLLYFKNQEKFVTKGISKAEIKSKYNLNSKNLTFFRNLMQLNSNEETTITNNVNLYKASKFIYFINTEELRGEKIFISSNYKKPNNDKFYFSNGIINLNSENFIAKDTEILVNKNIFDNPDNNPRIKGVSSKKKGEVTTIYKGVFTSCKNNDDCPPWAIQADQIKHDKKKQEISYKNAILKVYNVPILYFPKFFHPDPTVKRKSGILKPFLNNSNVLGNSFTVPYYHVVSNNIDFTLTPTIFENGIKMIQSEFRKEGKHSKVKINFGHTRDFKSSLENKKKNISYLFSNIDLDLNFENFNLSKLYFNVEKVTNDTFLKIFDTNLDENTTSLKPNDNNKLSSEVKLILKNDNFNFSTGFQSYENLQLAKSDRYQFILPYYDFNKILFPEFNYGTINLNSNGSNDLNNTNQLKTRITNNISFSSLDYLSDYGFINNFNYNLKNLNSLGKNITEYKSSPQVEISSLFEVNSSLPLKKEYSNQIDFLTPKVSFRINPGDMKNHSGSERIINTENIYSIDRLGLGDSFESGKSLTVGVDYKKQLQDMNKYFEFKLASVFRDDEENFMPRKTSLDKKTSNIFGSASTNFFENLDLQYNFTLDKDLDKIKYNDINASLSLNNFVTKFNFIKETDEVGDENFLSNKTSYEINDKNKISFSTRRNRKINLTEFYNLVYEYKNDCLTAGIKYKKTYYEDRDLKPVEDLLFTLTLFPLTTYEHKIDQFN